MRDGTVKFFNKMKGFGFITANDTQEEIFVHLTGLVNNINENDKVKFETQHGPKGLSAINVEVIR